MILRTEAAAVAAAPVTGEQPFSLPRYITDAILEEFSERDEPLYIYDCDRIRNRCRRFSFDYQPLAVHFATMANAAPEFLGIIREETLNVFVNSLPHLALARAAGFRGGQIVFTASAMDDRTMRTVRESGAMVNLDSPGQIRRWTGLFPDAPFGIRCNIGSQVEARKTRAGYFIGKDSRLGLSPQEIAALSGDPRVHGLHLYAGTDICSIGYFRECYEALGQYAGHFPHLRYLDFGGGFGLHGETGEPFDFQEYGTMLTAVMDRLNASRPQPLEVVLEPGRIIGADAGYFACKVIDIKNSAEHRLIGVNASSVQFPRPLFYPDSAVHPVVLLRGAAGDPVPPEACAVRTSIYGCSTYSRDFLARNIVLPAADENDIVVFGEAGSYCSSSYTGFLGFERPREIYR